MDNLISTRRTNLVLISKKEDLLSRGFCCFSELQIENKRKQKDRQILGPYPETKNAVEHKGDGNTNCTWNDPQRIGKEIGTVGNWRKNLDHSNYSIVKISQNTERSPGDLRRLAITQTPKEDH